MAKPRPYPTVPSAGPLLKTVEQFRSTFPPKVDAAVLQKLSLAPSNEGYVINVLKFLGIIDEDGSALDGVRQVFGDDDEGFARGMEQFVGQAYKEVFESFGDKAWELDRDRLVPFFRKADSSTKTVGERQAGTFLALAGLSGRRELPSSRTHTPAAKGAQNATNGSAPRRPAATRAQTPTPEATVTPASPEVGLTVRIEVNLPPSADQETYDRIFRSIRENLINARVS